MHHARLRKHVQIGTPLSLAILLLLFGLFTAASLHAVQHDWSLACAHPSAECPLPEEDLANLWMAGRLARLGHLDWLYTGNLFEAWRNQFFGARLGPEPWIYPPTVLLIGVPLSTLPLAMAFAVWTIASILGAVLLLRHARLSWLIILVGLGAPASWRSLLLGQYGVITGALVVTGLLVAGRQPIRAGIMLGLCTLKPQQAIIVPAAWLAARNWQAIAAALLVCAALATATLAAFGGGSWMLFLTQSRLSMREILEAPLPQPNINTGVSVFWMLRSFGAALPACYAAQAGSAVVAACLVYRAWRLAEAEPLARVAVTACLSLMVTPYGYTSDMVAYSIAITALVANKGWRITLLDGLLWMWPGYCGLVSTYTTTVLTPIFVTTTAIVAWRQMVPPRPTRAPAFAA